MAQIIDFRTRREVQTQTPASPDPKMCCTRCGAEVWTILQGGQICCSDCEESCPFRINFTREALQ